jgi:DNA-binding NarL/FixJ family response regulator
MGIQATRTLTAEHPEVAIVILTTYADDTSVLAALHGGARSYLTKDADRADIARALHGAARAACRSWTPQSRQPARRSRNRQHTTPERATRPARRTHPPEG